MEESADKFKARQEEVWPPPPGNPVNFESATSNPQLSQAGRRLIICGAVGILLSIGAGIFFTVGETGRILNNDVRFPSLTLKDEVWLAAYFAFLAPPFNIGFVVGVLLVALGLFRRHKVRLWPGQSKSNH